MKKIKGPILFFISFSILNLAGILFLHFKSSNFLELKKKIEFQDNMVSRGYTNDFWEKQTNLVNILPNDEKILEFISSINNLSPKYDKLLLKFESDEPVATTGPLTLPFLLEISGSTKEVFILLNKVIRSTLPVEVISLSAETDNSFIDKTSLILRARLYVSENYYE